MAFFNVNQLDLEEQEQVEKLKHFWKKWGTPITALVTVGMLAFAGVRGYDWYQTRQAGQASALYAQLHNDVQAGDMAKVATSLKLMQDSYGSTAYAQQAGWLAAKTFLSKEQYDQARAALQLVSSKGPDVGLKSQANLQLVDLLIQEQKYDDALKALTQGIDASYAAIVTDRQGDIYALQGKKDEAIKAYTEAFKGMDAEEPYRNMVAIKLSTLGVDPVQLLPQVAAQPASAAASTASKPASAASAQ